MDVDVDAHVDPRIRRTRARVLDAAGDLLSERGLAGVTVEAVVARSGVAKTTIYRHWPSHQDLLVDVLTEIAPTLRPPDYDLDARSMLHQVCRDIAAALEDERWQRLLPALLLTRLEYGTIASLKDRIERQHISGLAASLQRLIDEGVIDTDSIAADVHLLIGPLLTRSLLDEDEDLALFADRVVERYLRATEITPGGR